MSPAEVLARFAATTGAPDEARAAVERFAAAAGLSREARLKVELVAEELVANTLSHGEVPAESTIELRLQPAEGGLLLEYADRGRAFDPTGGVSPREADPWHVGGFGWDLVRALCSEVGYRRTGGENRLRLRLSL